MEQELPQAAKDILASVHIETPEEKKQRVKVIHLRAIAVVLRCIEKLLFGFDSQYLLKLNLFNKFKSLIFAVWKKK